MDSSENLRQSPYYGVLLKLVKQFQDDPTSRIFAALADTYRKCQLFDEAVRTYEEGLNHHPNYIGAHVGYARCLYEMGNYVKAIDILERKIGKIQENLKGLEILAGAYEKIGNYENAYAWLKVAHDLVPFDQRYKNDLDRLKDLVEVQGTKNKLKDLENPVLMKEFDSSLRDWSYAQASEWNVSNFEEEEKSPPNPPKQAKKSISTATRKGSSSSRGNEKEKKIQILQNILEKLSQHQR